MYRSATTALLLAMIVATGQVIADDDSTTAPLSAIQLAREARAAITEITPAELSAELAAEHPLMLIDVRTEREFQAGHLRGASWIPRGKLEFALAGKNVAADREIVLYCRTGGRAALAARTLQDMGYTKVTSLEGGFKQWAQDGRSIYNQHGEIRVVEFEASEGKEGH